MEELIIYGMMGTGMATAFIYGGKLVFDSYREDKLKKHNL